MVGRVSVPCFASGDQDYEWRPPTGLGWWFWQGLVMIQCPSGHRCHLGHTIAADGLVTPSAVCPVAGCLFHEFVHLVGWNGGIRKRVTTAEVIRRRVAELGGEG